MISHSHNFSSVVKIGIIVEVFSFYWYLFRWRIIFLRRLLAAQTILSTITSIKYFPLVTTVLPQILRVWVQNLTLHFCSRLLQQSSTLFYVLVVEIRLKLKLLQIKHSSYEGIDIECVEKNQQKKQGRKDIRESLSKDRNYLSLPHYFWEGRVLLVDHLQEVIAKRSWHSRSHSIIYSQLHGKE